MAKRKPKYIQNDYESQMEIDRAMSMVNKPTTQKSFNPNGFKISNTFKTNKQKEMFDAITNPDNRIIFVKGYPGTGKTFVAIMAALELLKNENDISRITFTKDFVEASRSMGLLPGTLEEKSKPLYRSFYDCLGKLLPETYVNYFIENKIITNEILSYMRGVTLGDTNPHTGKETGVVAILDEAQNLDVKNMYLYLSRLGTNSKMIILGDSMQRDIKLNSKDRDGLEDAYERLQGVDGIAFIEFDYTDVVRDKFLVNIFERYIDAI